MCLFIKQFLTNPVSTGAIHPSSEQLADLITQTANLQNRKTIIEIGSGTGVFTEKISHKKKLDSDFFVIELNPFFVRTTRKRCPDVNIIEGSAENINLFLSAMGYNGCDCIISGLPWASFGQKLQDSILEAINEALVPGGVFLTFSYLQSLLMPSGRRFRGRLSEVFGSFEQSGIVWKNIPPAFVYSVTKPGN